MFHSGPGLPQALRNDLAAPPGLDLDGPAGWLRRRLPLLMNQGLLVDLGLVAATLALLWLGTLLHIRLERRESLTAAERHVSNLAGASQQILARTIEAIDQRLLFLREAYRQDRIGFSLDFLRRENGIQQDMTLQTAIIGPDGRLLMTNLGPVRGPGLDLSDRAHFRVHAESPRDDLFISVPVMGRESKRWSVQFTRRLTDPDGGFGGVAVISLDPGWLTQVYDTLDIGRGTVTLTGEDGILRARAPFLSGTLGNDLSGSEAFRSMVGREASVFRGPSVATGMEMIIAARRVRPYPVMVAVGIDLRDALAGHEAYRRSLLNAVAGLTLILLVGGGLMVRQRLQRLLSQQQIRHMAHHDALTGLANRVRLQEQLRQWLRQERPLAVLALDLDRFKPVNDTYGHHAGDQVLRQVAGRLLALAGPHDLVARMGGDEFLLLCDAAAGAEAMEALGRRILASVAAPYLLEGCTAQIGTSIGIALFPRDGTSPDALLRGADAALYAAKTGGRGALRFFLPDMEDDQRERRALEAELREAVRQQTLGLEYQPILACGGALRGFEALLRWSHPRRGPVPPAKFIPLAEECGLILPLGRWVLQQACGDAARWPAHLRVAVNLSPVQLRDPGLPAMVKQVLASTGLPPGRLELEVTEGLLIEDAQQALAAIESLKRLGVRLALDDFGTGYASLGYLHRFPFDRIKVDRSFIGALGQRKASHAIVEAMLTMSASLGMEVTAEGVETAEQLDFLRRHDCDEVQGFLLGRPQPLARLDGLLLAPLSCPPPG
ncbi:putative bifunctional diguanylate cyclase/phosphodiesterase [Teichococcus aerofrigidensis]